jgi:tetratricopeptide (TPR) repeat protein
MTVSSRTRIAVLSGVIIGGAGLAWAIRPQAASATLVANSVERFEPGRTTSFEGMAQTVATARRRLAADPADVEAAVSLADVLMRQGRVERHGAHGAEAEAVLRSVLREEPDNYTAIRMLGVTLLAQHRFRDAVTAATRAIGLRPTDAWNYGVLGDAQLELGEYEQAFDAFDRMAAIRPDASVYARVAYAHELQGRLGEALRHMRRAAEATGAHDPESLAWHYAQLGHLYLEAGAVESARREFAHADYVFPGHPYARFGLARVAAARRDYASALRMYQELLVTGATPEIAASVGDMLALTGDSDGAAAMYAKAEALEREGWKEEAPQPAALARMLAERGLKTADAVALGEEAAATRSDIFTMDALALAYFRAGRLDEAAAASNQALRTGTGDRRLLYHAAAIAHARGRADEARRLLARVLEGTPALDVTIVQGVEALARALS